MVNNQKSMHEEGFLLLIKADYNTWMEKCMKSGIFIVLCHHLEILGQPSEL